MNTTQLRKVLGWAAYLGCSWTWCIGMFLPALLLRDFGWLAWVTFAVPNVVGAAAMGFVLADAHASERFVTRHQAACKVFSVVTILFQLFFLWWATAMIRPPVALAGGLLVLLFLLYWYSRSPEPKGLVSAGLVFIFSLVAMVVFAKALPFSQEYLTNPAFGAMSSQLWCLVPVFLFGFAFSPYLDLTFHHASQQTTAGTTKASYVMGFGLVFFTMLVFSLLYAPSIVTVFFAGPSTQDAAFQLTTRTGLRLLLFAHFFVQAGFTVILHLHRLKKEAQATARREMFFVLIAILVTLLLWAVGRHRSLFALSGHELIYRVFLAFYGLIFPTYIWTCVIPFATLGRNRKADWITCAAALCVGLPFFAWAFLAAHYHALIPGLCLVLAAPLMRALYYRKVWGS